MKCEWQIPESEAGRRLDVFLRKLFPHLPLSRIYSAIRKKEVRVNRYPSRPNYKLCAGDSVTCSLFTQPASIKTFPPNRKPKARQKCPYPILYEDDWLVAIDKPPGTPVHAGTPPRHQKTVVKNLVDTLREIYPTQEFSYSLSPLHRLDKGASGIVVFARTLEAHRHLAYQWKEGKVEKVYHAVVSGIPKKSEGTVAEPLSIRKNGKGKKVQVDVDGKRAITEYKIRKKLSHFLGITGKFSLLEIRSRIGRTHQIRVHLSFLGTPIVGDTRYGSPYSAKRIFLHCAQIRLEHPSFHNPLTLTSTSPRDFPV